MRSKFEFRNPKGFRVNLRLKRRNQNIRYAHSISEVSAVKWVGCLHFVIDELQYRSRRATVPSVARIRKMQFNY